MEIRHKTVDTRELLETYRELLPQVETLPLVISGNSMSPFLVHGRDKVFLSAVRDPLKVGDIVLYQRDSGAYILHRICALEGEDRFCIVGDAQTALEHGIRRDQIFGMVRSAERKGKKQAPGTFWWEFFEKIWVRMIPLRPVVSHGYSLLTGKVRRREQ